MGKLGRGSWAVLVLMACGGDGAGAGDDPGGTPLGDGSGDGASDGVCEDLDGDGYGPNCARGDDCDDRDETVFDECGACTAIREGCTCAAGTAPLECKVPASEISDTNILCKTGRRYCRDGLWTGCLGVAGYSK